jgi:hypothetical protein
MIYRFLAFFKQRVYAPCRAFEKIYIQLYVYFIHITKTGSMPYTKHTQKVYPIGSELTS